MSYTSRSPEDSSEPPRKKMRKGTHSCSECRRRKVRCIFTPDDASVCSECVARGTRCTSQEEEEPVPDQRKNLRERVGRLEALVESLIKRTDENIDDLRKSPTPEDPALHAADLPVDSSSRAAGLNDIAPALSLFDNIVLGRKDPLDAQVSPNDKSETASSRTVVSPGESSRCPTTKGKIEAVRQALTKLIPSERDLETLFNSTSGWWLIWRDLCAAIYESTTEISLTQVVSRALRKGHPIIIAHSLLCVAISIQQLPPTFDYSRLRLPMPAEDLMKHYMHIVHRLVVSDDEFAGTLDGLDVMILHSKLHVNLGQPRQAWLTFRRATSFGLLMGLHRDPCLREDTLTPLSRRRRNLWWKLYSSDRYLSVLLGLPHAVPDSHCNVAVDDEDGEREESPEVYRRRTTILCSRVIDRNQSFDGPDLTLTLQIDQQLDDLRRHMPEEWWQLTQKADEASSSHYDRITAHFWYHQVRALVHQPFFLQSLTNSSYEYSRLVCLSASREMIKSYLVLRENAMVGPYLCKVIDFQVFTAAMLLLVNLMGVGRLWPAVEPERDQEDSDLVDSTIEILRGAASEVGSSVASQSLAVLEALKVNKNAAYGQACDDCTKKLVIPFFGTITIGPGSGWQKATSTASSTVVQPTPPAFIPPPPSVTNSSTVPFGDYPPPPVPLDSSVGNFFGQYLPGGHLPHSDNFASTEPSWQTILNMDLNQNWNLSLDNIGLGNL